VTLRTGVVVGSVLGLLGLALGLMVVDARAGDWPGWDEGWAVVAFPLGIPPAVAAGLGLGRAASPRRIALVTFAVWSWGAVLFLAWLVTG
jgi:hypothetical protein